MYKFERGNEHLLLNPWTDGRVSVLHGCFSAWCAVSCRSLRLLPRPRGPFSVGEPCPSHPACVVGRLDLLNEASTWTIIESQHAYTMIINFCLMRPH